jgi:predicted RNase H-like HicB family nuclease
MSRYIALAHRGETGSWGISFPDFPGCISAAHSFEDVVEQGAEALRFHVEGVLEDGEAIPEPRPLEVLRADPEFADDFVDAIVTVVPLLPPRDRPMRVNVILDANLLADIDRTAEQLSLNRSEFLAEGARRLIVSPEKAKQRTLLAELLDQFKDEAAAFVAAGEEDLEKVKRPLTKILSEVLAERTATRLIKGRQITHVGRVADPSRLVPALKKAARRKASGAKKR